MFSILKIMVDNVKISMWYQRNVKLLFSWFVYLGRNVGDGKTCSYWESQTAGRRLSSISKRVVAVVAGVTDCKDNLGLEDSTSCIDWIFGRALNFPLAASTEAGRNCSWYVDAEASSRTCSNGVFMRRGGADFSALDLPLCYTTLYK